MSFEEDFPSLKDRFTENGQVGLNITAVRKHCVDKQKVRKSFDIIQSRLNLITSGRLERQHVEDVLDDEIKELGLDDTVFGMKIKTDKKLKEGEFRLE